MFNNMICSWCEQDNELITLCKFDNHNVCKLCYKKYCETYPLRVEGCPYCKGIEEKVMQGVSTPDDATNDNSIEVLPHEPETTYPVSSGSHIQDLACDNGIISAIIASLICVLFIIFCFSKVFMIII